MSAGNMFHAKGTATQAPRREAPEGFQGTVQLGCSRRGDSRRMLADSPPGFVPVW